MFTSPLKPLIYLDPNSNPKPYQNPLIRLLEGKVQVEISRTGLELEIDRIENLASEYKSLNVDRLSTLKDRILQPRKLWGTLPADV